MDKGKFLGEGRLMLCTSLFLFVGVGNGNLFQYYCLENSIDRGACQATVHGATKSQKY